MPRRIDKRIDDKDAGIRFHMSSSRLPMARLSYVAFQRFLDEMERSMYLCPDCGWRGRGRDLVPMEQDGGDVYMVSHEAEAWYACPKCECEIAVDRPIMRSAE